MFAVEVEHAFGKDGGKLKGLKAKVIFFGIGYMG